MSRKKYEPFCTVPNCGGTHRARGYCNRHYQQIKKRGQLLDDVNAELLRTKLQKRRIDLGMTIAELSERAGINAIRYGQIERGNIELTDKMRSKIHAALEGKRYELMKHHYAIIQKLDSMEPFTFEDFEFYGSEDEWK